MYPPFLQETIDQGAVPARFSLKFALAVEEIHHALYREATKAVQSSNDLPERKIYVCGVCGNTVDDYVPDMCPVCDSAGPKFSEID